MKLQKLNQYYHVKEKYMELDKLITATSEYEMVELDRFTPTESQDWYTFIRQLQLSSPIVLYQYHRSSSLATTNWIWKLPQDKKQRSHSPTLKNIQDMLAFTQNEARVQ